MNEVIKTILQRRAVRKYEALAFYRGYGPGSA